LDNHAQALEAKAALALGLGRGAQEAV